MELIFAGLLFIFGMAAMEKVDNSVPEVKPPVVEEQLPPIMTGDYKKMKVQYTDPNGQLRTEEFTIETTQGKKRKRAWAEWQRKSKEIWVR